MRIISKFQDYYDVGIAYGIDEKLRFERVTEIQEECCGGGEPWSHHIFKNQRRYRVWFFFDLIGFCGEIYPLIHVVTEENRGTNKQPDYRNMGEEYFYTIDTFETYVKEQIDPKGHINPDYGYGAHRRKLNIVAEAEEYFEEDYTKQKRLFDLYEVNYFAIESDICMQKRYRRTSTRTILHPQLKKYKFARALAPMVAFQILSMYLGAKNEEKEIVQIDDKYLAQGKGFDCYSFKRMPKKRNSKKC